MRAAPVRGGQYGTGIRLREMERAGEVALSLTNADGVLRHGDSAAAAGRYREAAKHYSQVLTAFPDLGVAHYRYASVLEKMGHSAAAARERELAAQYGVSP